MLEQEEGVRVLEVTGGLYMGKAGCELVAGSVRSAVEHGLAHEVLRGGEIERRWPVFAGLEGMEGVYEAGAGFLRPERAVAGFAVGAMRRGAVIKARERVLGWERDGGGFVVRTDRGVYTCGRIVVTAGPWVGALVGRVRGKVVVTRQVMGWVWPREVERFEKGVFPSWCMEVAEGGLVYGPPMTRGEWEGGPVGLKVSHHFAGEVCEAGIVERGEKAGDWAVVRRVLKEHVPLANGEVMGMKVCLYTNSADGHFYVDEAEEGVVFAGGFSGHGFKFASVMGEVLADLAVEGRTGLPVGFLRVGRCGGGG
jgi:sarcosine oxidase